MVEPGQVREERSTSSSQLCVTIVTQNASSAHNGVFARNGFPLTLSTSLKNLTRTVSRVARETEDRGPDGDRAGRRARAEPSAVWRETTPRTPYLSASAFACHHVISTLSSNIRVTITTDYRPSLICLQGLLANAQSKTISTNVRVHAPCPCTCNGTRA